MKFRFFEELNRSLLFLLLIPKFLSEDDIDDFGKRLHFPIGECGKKPERKLGASTGSAKGRDIGRWKEIALSDDVNGNPMDESCCELSESRSVNPYIRCLIEASLYKEREGKTMAY